MVNGHDQTGSRIGMWLFLYTEIILFGGLFVLYAAYYHEYPRAFAEYGRELNRVIGAANTVLLLISSFTVAASLTALRQRAQRLCMGLLAVSLGCGALFLVNKYFEWGHKFEVGLYPNSPTMAGAPAGKNIFFGLYYVITGLHGLHVLIGMSLLALSLVLIHRQRITADRVTVLENSGLYWHLVDLIWIFVFPLFYLIL
ncbi:cytochrome c oxidase subunit 3 family protein [Desulfobulbus sp.]|uniref:cytochrome c oxidase subunit 3 family protein n=1 Tax=Desulfobulbus sp. TaxID=895 RepID=UPI00286F7027|nr:cytochrome c oxidase subunit 3 family protein [Desulfobulbus sp.]